VLLVLTAFFLKVLLVLTAFFLKVLLKFDKLKQVIHYKHTIQHSKNPNITSMGIPFYFKTIVDRYPGITKSLQQFGRIQGLLLDFNSIIHHCSQTLLQEKLEDTSAESVEAILIDRVCSHTMELVSHCAPEKYLYIAIDGVPCRAKVEQQRKRRFLGSWQEESNSSSNSNSRCSGRDRSSRRPYTSNVISPGTAFMIALSERLRVYVPANLPVGIEFHMSDSLEEGEGEHKMFAFLREKDPNPNLKHLIVGLDADLIMLSLLHTSANIGLLRDPHTILDMSTFQSQLIQHLTPLMNIADHRELITTYVFLCFLVGNDFIPHLTYLQLKESAIERLIESHASIQPHHPLLVPHKSSFSIRWEALWKLIEHLANTEDLRFFECHDRYMNKQPRSYHHHQHQSQQQQQQQQQYPLKHKHLFPIPDNRTWRTPYYKHLFGSHDPSLIGRVCENYTEGLEWLVRAYFHHEFHRGWYYRYLYSPSARDLFHHLIERAHCAKPDALTHLEDYDDCAIPDTTIHQLCILPVSTLDELYPEKRAIWTDASLGCVYMFPVRFSIETYQKEKLWECYPRLPPLNIRALQEASFVR
jgi:5'-3' exonuclease